MRYDEYKIVRLRASNDEVSAELTRLCRDERWEVFSHSYKGEEMSFVLRRPSADEPDREAAPES